MRVLITFRMSGKASAPVAIMTLRAKFGSDSVSSGRCSGLVPEPVLADHQLSSRHWDQL